MYSLYSYFNDFNIYFNSLVGIFLLSYLPVLCYVVFSAHVKTISSWGAFVILTFFFTMYLYLVYNSVFCMLLIVIINLGAILVVILYSILLGLTYEELVSNFFLKNSTDLFSNIKLVLVCSITIISCFFFLLCLIFLVFSKATIYFSFYGLFLDLFFFEIPGLEYFLAYCYTNNFFVTKRLYELDLLMFVYFFYEFDFVLIYLFGGVIVFTCFCLFMVNYEVRNSYFFFTTIRGLSLSYFLCEYFGFLTPPLFQLRVYAFLHYIKNIYFIRNIYFFFKKV